jgi:16S rRNA (adenine1518-N6/adenine1519-N6)-dimethyltransferase
MEAKKSLGQNFFINKNLGDTLISKIEVLTDTVVEIGPGQGFFTERLSTLFKDIILIEKDTQIAKQLATIYPKATIYNEDFLEFDLNRLPKQITFFGSLPYNVSKPIIRKIIESEHFTNPAYFIIQKEVAQKYTYIPPYNILNLTTNCFADVKKLLNISPEAFRPRPNVNSTYTRFSPNMKKVKDIDQLNQLINIAFKQPRKTLKNNLSNSKFSKGLGRYETKRPSDLTVDNYIEILNNSY